MEPNNFIDTIKTKKPNTFSRYQTFTNITKLFHTIELLVFLTLISWSSTHLPFVLNLSCHYMTSLSSYFNNQHVVFVVGNVIVVVCYILSRYPDSVNDVNGNCNFTHRKTSSGDHMTSAISPEIQTPVFLNKKSDAPMTSAKEGETEEMTWEYEGIERRYKGTKSEKVRSENKVKGDREMRRGVAGRSGRGEGVEKMSNEEFRMAVEKFILKQQRFLKEQQIRMVAEDES